MSDEGGTRASRVTKLGDLLLPKACENCKIRKCRVASKGSDSRQRAPASTYHEKHFALIHESLREISEKLGKIDASSPRIHDSVAPCLVETGVDLPFVPETAFQSETSFDSYSVQASVTAEVSAAEVVHDDLDQEIRASLTAVKSLLRGHGSRSSFNNLSFPQSVAKTTVPKLELPPMPVVIELLQKASGRVPLVILHSGLDDDSFLEELCKKIYFPTKHVSKGEITLMNGILFYVFAEHCRNDDVESAMYIKYARLCEENFVAGLQDYDCLVTPTLENIQSLLLGALKAQEDCRPALCWTFVSTGARLCQTLGYHRESVVCRDSLKLGQAKRHVFWMLHMIDKTLSLNLGHTSNFPSHDIDVEMYSPSNNPEVAPWNRVMIAFAGFSVLQGRLYDELYSVRARRESPETRCRIVEELSSSLHAWRVDFNKIDTTGAQCSSDLDIIIGSSDFIFYSVLTILFGAQTSSIRISSQRYEVARKSLECHVENWAKLSPTEISKCGIYSDWLIDYASFAPFLVVFMHAIATRSASDVSLLSQILSTLESMRSRSDAHVTLCQKCRVFLRFATAFMKKYPPHPAQHTTSSCQNEEEHFFFPSTGLDAEIYERGVNIPDSVYGLGSGTGDLDSMDAFLGSCFGDSSTMGGIWNMDFEES